MTSDTAFARDYPDARRKFLTAAAAAGAPCEAVLHPEKGPDGGALAVDAAWLGRRDAPHVLVLLSGTHGVEGFCGSAAQIDWLRRGESDRLGNDVAVLLIHAVNPWGFAWLRRTTHENIDLNRNWVDFAAPLPANPEYDALADALLPSAWSDEARQQSAARLFAFAQERGFDTLQHAITRGQHSHPSGIFYGGAAPSWSRVTQSRLFSSYLGQAKRIVIIDYHSGLGPAGYAEPISGTAALGDAVRIFGGHVTSSDDGSSVSAPIVGDGLSAAAGLLPQAHIVPLALEFGTLPGTQVLDALRADAWLHAHGELGSDQAKAIKRQVRDAFYIDDDLWRGMVLGQSLQYTRMAIAALQR
ncbi:MAG: M14 family metallopeptidase [Sphingopyxis sp.]|uniref:M14 family metallopeptidase n=1 Tax=Sphingopyxis sp. TaxID=1908224 RepID=UPI002AB9644D|nr:M14 family metallopeptidase [Sphingopyxis sp.]MDZ3833604.1 M14 family metallopeptidase [Sphingopyxis sp.]